MGFFADIANGTMSSILESKQYENTGIGKKVAENKIKVERDQQAIKKHVEEVYAGNADGLPIGMPVSGLALTEAMKKSADKQDVIADKLCSSADEFNLSLRQKGENIDKTKLFIENAIDEIKREGMK